jgi:hypothetical protein
MPLLVAVVSVLLVGLPPGFAAAAERAVAVSAGTALHSGVGAGEKLEGPGAVPTAATPVAADNLASCREEQWRLLNNHVVWAKGGPMVKWDAKAEPTTKPVMLVGGKPDAPYRPGEVDIDRVFLDNHCLIWQTDRDALDVIVRRTRALLDGLRKEFAVKLDGEAAAIGKLEIAAKTTPLDSARRKELFLDACAVQRRTALANPLLDFDEMIFITGDLGLYGRWQDVGFDSGGVRTPGPLVLSDWKTDSPKVRRVLPEKFEIDGKRVNLAGSPKDKGGAAFHINFDLSFDGKTLLFAAGARPANIFKYELGGNEVVQLTRSQWDHGYDPQNKREHPASSGYPCWLPDGRIAYVSERGAKGDRCEGRTCQLFSMKADGSDAHPLSWHETPEYHPVVDHDGMLVYSRWDYVDRGFNEAHNLWRCYPDGRDPRAPHGNYAPSFFGGPDGLYLRPWAESHIRPIPGKPGHYVAIAGIHHGSLPGLPVLINLNERDDGKMAQVQMLVGHFMVHESGGGLIRHRNERPLPGFRYVTPWPLSRDYHLISDMQNLLLIDRYGNVVPLYSWDGPGKACSPRPLRPRPAPPVIPTATWQGERAGRPDHRRATIAVQNVYEYDLGWPAGVVEEKRIKALRIVQILGLPVDYRVPGKNPNFVIGAGVKQIARTVLGTVPVEEDGSAYFEAPVGKTLSFQALDERGMMIVGMRSATYVHPGEQLSCVGCHEDKWRAPTTYTATALRRSPSKITPEPEGSNPLTYFRLVKPVFEKTCLPCHVKEKQGPQSFVYDDLVRPVINGKKRESLIYNIGAWGHGQIRGSRSEPYKMGAYGSRMGQALLKTHMDRINPEEFRRIVVWLDCNSPLYGTYFDLPAQAEGKVVWHPLEVDPKNPLGIEVDRPLPGRVK